jgi:hypothetical protein
MFSVMHECIGLFADRYLFHNQDRERDNRDWCNKETPNKEVFSTKQRDVLQRICCESQSTTDMIARGEARITAAAG